MALYVEGVVTCRRMGSAEVEPTFEQRERLAAGRLVCPCCGTACGASFAVGRVVVARAWDGVRWIANPPVER